MGIIAAFQRLFAPKRAADLPASESFEALRAFGVEAEADEGPSYFIELADRRVLFVTGPYLQAARPFPCTSFTIRRQRGHIVELVCSGGELGPEVMTLPFTRSERKQKRVPKDGALITGKSYEAIKLERLAAASLGYE